MTRWIIERWRSARFFRSSCETFILSAIMPRCAWLGLGSGLGLGFGLGLGLGLRLRLGFGLGCAWFSAASKSNSASPSPSFAPAPPLLAPPASESRLKEGEATKFSCEASACLG